MHHIPLQCSYNISVISKISQQKHYDSTAPISCAMRFLLHVFHAHHAFMVKPLMPLSSEDNKFLWLNLM